MKKLIIFFALVFGIFLDGVCQSYYIKHENLCRGSSYVWTIYDAMPSDTIVYRSRIVVDGTNTWVYDTIVGNSMLLFPNDSMNRFEIVSINYDPNVCKERLHVELYGYTGNSITVSNNTITLPDVAFIKIINASDQHVYNCYTSTSNTTVTGIPSGNYNIVIIDDMLYKCQVTIPITIP